MNLEGKIFLFGGSGFLGPSILERYRDIISVGRTKPPEEIKNEHIHIDSLDNLTCLDELDFDKVIFLIGNSNHHEINKGGTMGLDYNVIPLKKALDYFKRRKLERGSVLKKFIAFSGGLMYDWDRITLPVDEKQPINPYVNDYLFSKYMAEELTKCYPEVPTITVRLSNIYGPTRLSRPDFVQILMEQILSPEETKVWSTKPERDFLYLKDAADAIVSLSNCDYTGIVNLGTGEMNSCGRVVDIVEKLSGKKVKVLDRKVSGQMKFVADNSLLKNLTGWEPKFSLKEGLKETYEIMKEYADECRWWEKKS